MRKIKKRLQKNEIPILTVRKHWIIFLPPIITLFFSSVLILYSVPASIFVFPFILFIVAIKVYFSTGFIITNKNIIGLCEGIFFKIPLIRILSIVIHETSLGKRLGYATLVISSSTNSYILQQIVKRDFLNKKVIASLNLEKNATP